MTNTGQDDLNIGIRVDFSEKELSLLQRAAKEDKMTLAEFIKSRLIDILFEPNPPAGYEWNGNTKLGPNVTVAYYDPKTELYITDTIYSSETQRGFGNGLYDDRRLYNRLPKKWQATDEYGVLRDIEVTDITGKFGDSEVRIHGKDRIGECIIIHRIDQSPDTVEKD